MRRSKFLISLVCLLTGIMVAIQFQSNQEPKQRDTRDLWEIRTQLQKEQKRQLELYQEIAETEEILQQYQDQSEQELVQTLNDTIQDLKQKVGLTEVVGSGVVINVLPMVDETNYLQTYPTVSPELLNRLINELNTYGATDIAIENERIIHTTPIRLVNGKTYVNNRPLPTGPLEIKVLTNNPERMLDHVQVSQSRDEFALEYLDLQTEISERIILPKYEGVVDFDRLHVQDNEQIEMGEN
ncbi:DUF881 domain-containing protein [Aquibacillus sediminis]|uniref:DUF881 domain-containing protein n=1 Tax=Aquibacillus sediminis TaxID=2574734 RepID=UPI0011091917|nr:DUF881 domain-containing protein [Aquibacillus sediminis]